MDAPDDVKRAAVVSVVVEQAFPHDVGSVDLGDAAQHVDLAETFPGQATQRAAKLVTLAAHHVTAERAVGQGRVAVQAQLLGQVEDDRHGQHVVGAGELDELPAGVGLYVGRVNDGEVTGGQALAGDVVEDVERVGGGRLVALVAAYEAAAEVAGDHFVWAEVAAGECRLARARCADERDQGNGSRWVVRRRRIDLRVVKRLIRRDDVVVVVGESAGSQSRRVDIADRPALWEKVRRSYAGRSGTQGTDGVAYQGYEFVDDRGSVMLYLEEQC